MLGEDKFYIAVDNVDGQHEWRVVRGEKIVTAPDLTLFVHKMNGLWCVSEMLTGYRLGGAYATRKVAIDEAQDLVKEYRDLIVRSRDETVKKYGVAPYPEENREGGESNDPSHMPRMRG